MEWQELTLFIYITARMSGFILFNPILGQRNVPGTVRAGLILVLSVFTAAITQQTVAVPSGLLTLALRILLELFLGFVLGMIVYFFLYIVQLAGQEIDMQMGMTMNQVYDATSQTNATISSILLNALMILLFFAANGHHTLFRILITSGEIIPYGAVTVDTSVLVNEMLELFIACTLLGVKLCLPILASELLGQVGMGLLMKVIPQINIFAINIELKIGIGLILLLILISPFSEFLLQAEAGMLNKLEEVLQLMAP